MVALIVGLLVFLAVHSLRMFAPDLRQNFIADRGEIAFKVLYSLLSLIGLVLIVIGYGQTRLAAQYVWLPPPALVHVTALLTLIAFVLFAAAYVPGNRLKSAVGHPMAAGVKVWAFAHLLSNGRLGDMVLFGAFLAWAILNYLLSKKADRLKGVGYSSAKSIARDSMTIVLGVGSWLVFALWAHGRLIGVSPFA